MISSNRNFLDEFKKLSKDGDLLKKILQYEFPSDGHRMTKTKAHKSLWSFLDNRGLRFENATVPHLVEWIDGLKDDDIVEEWLNCYRQRDWLREINSELESYRRKIFESTRKQAVVSPSPFIPHDDETMKYVYEAINNGKPKVAKAFIDYHVKKSTNASYDLTRKVWNDLVASATEEKDHAKYFEKIYDQFIGTSDDLKLALINLYEEEYLDEEGLKEYMSRIKTFEEIGTPTKIAGKRIYAELVKKFC